MSERSNRLSARTCARNSSSTSTNGPTTSRGSRNPPVAAPARRVIMLRNTERAKSRSSLCSVSTDHPAIASSNSRAALAAASALPPAIATENSESSRSVAWRKLESMISSAEEVFVSTFGFSDGLALVDGSRSLSSGITVPLANS